MKLAAAALALVVTGCTIKVADPAPTTTVRPPTTITTPTTTPRTTVPAWSADDRYIAQVRANAPAFAAFLSDADILEFAQIICRLYDSGYDDDGVVQALYEVGTDSGVTQEFMVDSGYAAGAAVAAFCPEYRS